MLLISTRGQDRFGTSDSEPQLIAEAVAAYQHSNLKRARRGLSTLDTMTVPCITMTRTPAFTWCASHKNCDAVINGQWPNVETKVLRCVTLVGNNRRLSEGMESPEYRRVTFEPERMIAFKALAKSQWEKFLVD
jgi:hypothetical protein